MYVRKVRALVLVEGEGMYTLTHDLLIREQKRLYDTQSVPDLSKPFNQRLRDSYCRSTCYDPGQGYSKRLAHTIPLPYAIALHCKLAGYERGLTLTAQVAGTYCFLERRLSQ